MRPAKKKSTFKKFLLEGVKPKENTDSEIITDGGTLLWLCKWTKGEKFSKIFEMYIDRSRKFNTSTIVFGGYNKSTKDAKHKARSNKMSQIVEICDANACPLDQTDFLTNYINKRSFVNLSGYKLELHGFKAVLCPSDADTAIMKRRTCRFKINQSSF